MSHSKLVIRAAAGLALMLLLAPALQAQDVDAGLVARYAFDGDVADDGPNGYNGRTVGSPSYERGMLGQAIRLDGSADALQFPGIPNANWNGPFSASWFMQVDSLQDYSLLSKRDACTAGNHFDVQLGNNAPDLIGFELSRSGQIGTTVARAAANDGPWIHVAIVRDATSARVYVDGRAGSSVNVGTLNFGSVIAPLEFGGSPCVGTIGGPRRYRGMIDELRVYDRALSAAEVGTLSRVTGLSVTPGSGSPGTRITMRMSNLEAGRTYELRLRQGRTVNTLLATVANATESETASASVPNAAPGSYEIALLQRQPFQLAGGALVRTVPFTVAGGLTFSNITPQPQAGKRLQVTVGNLAPGSLQLKYNGRIVSGPTPVFGASSTLRFVAPADIPASFPATVTLRAELLSGRTVIRTGTTTITVTAPFTGPFAIATGLASSNLQPRPAQPVRFSGQLALADGATAADVEVSAYWVGNNGTVTPLPTSALTIGSNGQVTLDTESASFSSMTALTRTGPGRLRMVTSRFNATTGRRELETTDGPAMNTSYDTDPQTDITVRVRALVGNGNTTPLQGAYAVLDASAPVQFYTPPAPPPGGDSPYLTGGSGLVINGQPAFNRLNTFEIVSNQIQGAVMTLPQPAPECGNSLFRRYTDAIGRAEFLIQGDVQGAPASWQAVQVTNMTAINCTGGNCINTLPEPVYEFYLTVYTLHLGAGYRENNNSNVEIPSRFRIRYDRQAGSFEIRNERTGTTTTQQVSANIIVEVPAITQLGGFVTFSDPLMFQTLGSDYYTVPRIGSNGYGKWVDFAGVAGSFASAAPVRHIRFAHKPDAGGSIATAKLYLPNNNNGQPSVVGTFNRITSVDGCNLQEDGSFAGTETWELQIDGVLAQSWRFPRGVYFRTDATQRKACGFIEAINVAGGSGRRNICFYWQKLPDTLTESSGTMVVDDANPDDVRFERSAQVYNDRETSVTLPSTIDGEPVDPPRRRDNQTRTARGSYDRMTTQGLASSTRSFDGANPKQFAEAGGGRTSNSNLSEGSNIVEIGTDAYQTIIDESIPLFSWTWGVPELFGAQVYADLRLLADYYFYGELRRQDNSGERLDMTTDARFGIYINVGVDIDVLFGLFFDAGAYLTGYALSTMPTVITNNSVTRSGPCFYFGMTFTGYFDPCNLCPTPVITDTVPIVNTQTPDSCEFYDGTQANGSVLAAPRGQPTISPVTSLEQRQMRRHPAIAFGEDGNGQMMMLDSAQSLIVGAMENGALQPTRVLSTALNARQPQIVYYAPDRAVAVWAESALTLAAAQGADIATLARNQRLMYSLYNGAGWSSKRVLTAPGNGEAFPTLAACYARSVGCPPEGEVVAVWQRNQASDFRAPTHRLWYAVYAPATGWSALGEVARNTGSLQDITPSVTYMGGNPFVVWARQDGADLSNLARRQLAYRIIGVNSAQEITTLPTGVIAPSVRATSGLGVMVAFTKIDDGTGAIGTRQALHTARASCIGPCIWSWRRVLDRFDRAIYGERPQVVPAGGGDMSVVMRAFQFRGGDGEAVRQGDPFGTVVSSGDLLSIQVPAAAASRARTVAITADGASHFGAAAAYNPMSEEITTVAATFVPPNFTSVQAAVKAAGYETQVGYGKALAAVGGIEMNALPAAPDLGVESVATNLAMVAPGTAMQATVRIGNRGTAYTTARDGNARVELRWNLPTGTGAPLASATIASLGAGESRDVVLNFTTPANAHGDEAHTLYAVIIPADDQIELSGDNNVGSMTFDGLPVPFDLATFSSPGMAPVQMGWSAATDPRVAGYRVYRRDGTEWVALGSSPSTGFLDLSAQFGVSRTYAVSTYSVRGAESERSAPISAMPTVAQPVDDALLVDGFETPGS